MFSLVISIVTWAVKDNKEQKAKMAVLAALNAEDTARMLNGRELTLWEKVKDYFSLINNRRPGVQAVHNTKAIITIAAIFILTIIIVRKLK
jgi:hypothetical protein